MPKTPVQVTSATRERLSKLKSSPRESYDKIINKLLALSRKATTKDSTHMHFVPGSFERVST